MKHAIHDQLPILTSILPVLTESVPELAEAVLEVAVPVVAEAEFVPVVEADAAEVADAVSVETEPVGLPSAPMMMGMRPSL